MIKFFPESALVQLEFEKIKAFGGSVLQNRICQIEKRLPCAFIPAKNI